MKSTASEIKDGAISALENLNDDDPDSFFSSQDVNEQWEESKDYDSDNLKRGRLGRVSNKIIQDILIDVSGKQLVGYVDGCEIEQRQNRFRFIRKDSNPTPQYLKDISSSDWNSSNDTPLADIQRIRELTESKGFSVDRRTVTPAELAALNKLAGGLEPLPCRCSFNERGDMVVMCTEASELRTQLRNARVKNGPEMQAWLNHFQGAQFLKSMQTQVHPRDL